MFYHYPHPQSLDMSLQAFIFHCEVALEHTLTPLQKHEIQEFLSIARKTDNYTEDLRNRQQRLMSHWASIHDSISTMSKTFHKMTVVQGFLMLKLSEDYLSTPFAAPRAFINIFSANACAAYTSTILELMFDPEHCQRRLNYVLQRDGSAGNDVQQLIDQRQWSDLASTLVGDRLLLRELLKPVQQVTVLEALLEIRNKYFIRLRSGFDYELSEQARQLQGPEKGSSSKEDVPDDEVHLLTSAEWN